MAKKTKEKEPEVKVFEYGDLSVVCSCGATQVLKKGIHNGLQLVLTTREDSFIQLRCNKCEADIKLCFLEGEKPADEEPEAVLEVEEKPTEAVIEETNESVQEEDKQEQIL